MRSFPRSLLAALALAALPPAAALRAQALDELVVRLGGMSAVTGLEQAMADTLLQLLPGAQRDAAGNVVLARGTGTPALRFSHSPAEVIDLKDLVSMTDLVRAIAERW